MLRGARAVRCSHPVLVLLIAAACAEESAPNEPAPTPPVVDRSPEASEPPRIEARAPAEPPVEPPPGLAAAQHGRALEVLDEDPPRAASMLEAACDHGFAPSCVALADLLERGAEGVDPDLGRARALIEQACFGGSTSACDRMGH